MGVVQEQSMPETNPTPISLDTHSFWQNFPSRWLIPAANTFNYLTL